jgi:aspartate aminotransferase-like enzyme
MNASRIQQALLGHGIQISRGLSPVAETSLRIGLLGRTANQRMIDRLIEILDLVREETAN